MTTAIGNRELGDNPEWTAAHVDRAVALVERDKTHPCVILWSLGNEGGRGMNLEAMAEAVRSLDPSRPVYCDSDRGRYPPSMMMDICLLTGWSSWPTKSPTGRS